MGLGNKILTLRKKMGLSQEQLAEQLSVTRQTISKWELDETTPDLKQAKQLSKIFKVSLDELTDNDIKNVLVDYDSIDITEDIFEEIIAKFKNINLVCNLLNKFNMDFVEFSEVLEENEIEMLDYYYIKNIMEKKIVLNYNVNIRGF